MTRVYKYVIFILYKETKIMKTTTKALVNIKKLINTKDVQFKNFTTPLSVNWVDVYFKG